MSIKIPHFLTAAIAIATLSSTAFSQLTWDPSNTGGTGGTGTWESTAGNWWDGANGTTWDNTGATTALFPDAGGNQVVSLGSGLTVGDVTNVANILQFRGAVDNQILTIKSGGATWDTGGGQIEFAGHLTLDVLLTMGSDDTLTINGGGTFDGGERPNNANWSVANSILDVTEATIVRANTATIGQFGTVKLAGGSIVVQERNADQVLVASGNTWELAGDVTFGNRFNRKSYLSGVVSGAGRIIYKDGASQNVGFMRIDNAANTFSGGLTVDAENNATMVFLNSVSDGVLGAVPDSFDADNIILKNGGTFRSNQTLTLDANRGITLENGGILNVSNSKTFTIGGAIAGEGGLQIGYTGGHGGVLALAGANATYTGETQIFEGNVRIDATNAMGQGVLNLGGTEGFARLILSGQNQTFGGIYNTGSQTKQIVNINSATTGSTRGTLTIDVAEGETYFAGSATGVNAADDRGNFNLIKDGLGSQTLANLKIGGDVTVNTGELGIGGAGVFGHASVTGGTLKITGSSTGASFTTDGDGVLQIGSGGTAGSINDANIANGGGVVFNRSDAVTYSGVISGTGDFTASGAGTLALNVAQTYTGTTSIDNSVVTAGVANAFMSQSVLYLGGAGSGTSAFEMNGRDQQAGGLTFTAGSHTREIRNNGANATLTLNVDGGESYAWNANFSGSNSINLVKAGDGTQSFGRSGAYNTAIGDVTVNAGELIWNNNNAATQTGVVTVNAGGTLSGSGFLGGAVTIGGALNPGNSPGIMSFAEDLTLLSTATTTLELDGTTSGTHYDVLLGDSGNSLTAAGALTITLGYTAALNDSFLVFEDWSTLTGSFSSISVDGTALAEGLSLDTTRLLIDGSLTVVPEPSAFALTLGLGALAFIVRRRRR